MRILLTLTFSLVWSAGTLRAAEIALPQIHTEASATVVEAELLLSAQGAEIAALQVDLIPAAGLTVSAQIGTAASGVKKQLVTGDIASGKRFVIFGLNQSVIPDGAVITLSITLPKESSGTYALQLAGAIATDPLGAKVALVTRDGAILTGQRPMPVR